VRYFTGEARRKVADEPNTSESPYFGPDVVVKDRQRLGLAIQRRYKRELSFISAVSLQLSVSVMITEKIC